LPHFVLRYRRMSPDVARQALIATHGGLSLEWCATIFNISTMSLYRLICAFGHHSVVTVLTRCGLPLPTYILADEKHSRCLTERVYLPMIVRGRVLWHLGYSASKSAAAFTESYGTFQRAALEHEPSYPVVLVSRAVLPPSDPGGPSEGLIRIDHNGGPGRAEPQGAGVRATELPEPIDASGVYRYRAANAPRDSWGEEQAVQARAESERTLPERVPVPHRTAQKEPQPPAQRHTQRSGRPRGAPGKATHPHKKFVTGQQEPG
jgi:hypothetical protein